MTRSNTLLELVDIGVNLTHRRFASDLPDVLARAEAAGVVHLVVTGTSIEGSRAALSLARAHPDRLTATTGIHPHHASQFDAGSIRTLRELANTRTERGSAAVAIGECGLDYDRDFSPRAIQRACFAAQLALAAELGLPVFLHQRAAHEDFAAILREHRPSLRAAVVHCFTDGPAVLESYLELDCHVGVTGWITDERRGHALRESTPRVPPDRLMLETDAPFLTPRGAPTDARRRNEPAYLPLVLHAVAEVTRSSPAEVAAATTQTAARFFGLRGVDDGGR